MEKNAERIQFSDGTEIAIRGAWTLIDPVLLQQAATFFSDLCNWFVRGGSVCLNRFSGSISGMPAGFMPPQSAAAS